MHWDRVSLDLKLPVLASLASLPAPGFPVSTSYVLGFALYSLNNFPSSSGLHCCFYDKAFWPKPTWWRKGFILAYWLQSIERSQGKNSRQEPGGRKWSRNRGERLLIGLSSWSATFFILPRLTCLGMVLSTMNWVFLHQLAVKKMLHGHATANLRRKFLYWFPS